MTGRENGVFTGCHSVCEARIKATGKNKTSHSRRDEGYFGLIGPCVG